MVLLRLGYTLPLMSVEEFESSFPGHEVTAMRGGSVRPTMIIATHSGAGTIAARALLWSERGSRLYPIPDRTDGFYLDPRCGESTVASLRAPG